MEKYSFDRNNIHQKLKRAFRILSHEWTKKENSQDVHGAIRRIGEEKRSKLNININIRKNSFIF